MPEGCQDHREYIHSPLTVIDIQLAIAPGLFHMKQVLCQYWIAPAIEAKNLSSSLRYGEQNRLLMTQDMSSACLCFCTSIMTGLAKPLIQNASEDVAKCRLDRPKSTHIYNNPFLSGRKRKSVLLCEEYASTAKPLTKLPRWNHGKVFFVFYVGNSSEINKRDAPVLLQDCGEGTQMASRNVVLSRHYIAANCSPILIVII